MKLTKRLTIGLMILCALFGAILLGTFSRHTANAAETTETTEPTVILKGDINKDGKVDMTDILLAVQYVEGMISLSAEQIEIGDVVGTDGDITMDDAIRLCQRFLGQDVEFTACKHNNVDPVVTAPTCTEGGYTTYTCLSCGYIWTGEETAALIHSPATAEEENRTEATCTTTGSYDSVVYCAREGCHAELSRETKTIPSKGHTEAEAVEDNRREATCAKTGSYDSVVKCAVCKAELSRETKTIAKKDHANVITDEAVPATCMQIGWTEGSHCGDCGAIIKAQEVETLKDHTPTAIDAVAVGCTTSGWTAGTKCSVCDTILEAPELISAKGHQTEETRTIVTTANCTQEGEEKVTVTCTKCNTVLSENTVAIPMLAHTYENTETVEADHDFCKDVKKTCTICKTAHIFELSGNGNRTRHIMSSEIVSATDTDCSDVKFTCTNTECGYWYYQRSSTQDKTTHAWPTTGTTLTAATCLTDGVELYVCENCSSTKNGTLSATGHHYNEGVEVPATDAYCADTRYDCNDCDYYYYGRRGENSANATELTTHTLTSTTKAATCTDDGETTYTCTNENCNYTKTETISALGHNYTITTVDGTADQCADTLYTCSEGDSTYYVGYGESPAQEQTTHDWQETARNEATCYSAGLIVSTCSHCKATKNTELDKLTHVYEKVADVEATANYCKDTQYQCIYCHDVYYTGYVAGKTATALTLHEWDEGTVTKPVSCTTNGETTYTCTHSGCGQTKTEPIVAQGHNYVDGVCMVCGEKLPGVVAIDPSKFGELTYTEFNDGYQVTGMGTWSLPGLLLIPDTYNGKLVLSIAEAAFESNIDIRQVEIPDSVIYIMDRAFQHCTNLTSVTLGNGVTQIRYAAFSGCTALTSVTFGNSLTSIYQAAFNRTALTNVVIPNGVISIGRGAFQNCDALTNVVIPDSVTLIDEYAFNDCEKLMSVTIGNGVKTISIGVFCKDPALTSVTIGNGVETIGMYAFGKCSKLATVYYKGTSSQWNAISISSNNDVTYGDNSYFRKATRYYYSETQPTDTINKYWHYVDNVPTPW